MKSQVQIANFPVSELLGSTKRIIFVSPHLDDALFSAGSLMLALQSRVRLEVITLCTTASDPVTLSAKEFLKQSHYTRIDEMFEDRRSEDKRIFDELQIPFRHAGFSDALCRKIANPSWSTALLGKLLPEFLHVYPTYRFHIAKGKVSLRDQAHCETMALYLKSILTEEPDPILFCPIGTGGHVDHLIAKAACEKSNAQIVYWNDFPYSQHFPLNHNFIEENELNTFVFPVELETKTQLLKKYRTQFNAVFENGVVPAHQEMYFTKFR